ncbi:MAG: hypothetical protein IKG18_04110, partial [Atopobiaceae bacterium]|nr:hypothetical protein [Atopobiaceae bacterium]
MGEVWPMRGPARRVVAFALTAFMTLGTVPAQALEEIASVSGDEQSQEVAKNDSLELAGDENASDVSAMLGDDGVEELTPIEGDVEQSSDDATDDGLAGDDSLEIVEEDATTDESEAADDSEALVVEDVEQDPEAEDGAAVEAAEDSGKATVVAEDGTLTSTNGIVAQADAAVPITKAKAAKIADQAYTGKAVRPAVSLTYGGARLRAGTDYTVSYRNNTEAGTATATVTGAGGFTGTRSLRFRIVRPSVTYGVHRQTYGDQEDVRDGAVAGTTGESKRLEAMWVSLGGGFPVAGGIAYRTHVQGIGWQGWRSDGEAAGTRGESRRLEAVQVKLTGRMAKGYDVWYRVHAQNVGWMGWAKNGRAAGTSGLSWRLEAIQVVVLPRGSAAPGDVAGVSPATPERYVKR